MFPKITAARLSALFGAVVPISLTVLLVSGCQVPDRVKAPILHAAETAKRKFAALTAAPPCDIQKTASCPAEQICAYAESSTNARPECTARYAGKTPVVRFPYEPKQSVACTEGTRDPALVKAPLSPKEELPHLATASINALDLASPPDKPAATVYAAMDGTALVYRDCTAEPAEPADYDCAEGLGNFVRIVNAEGFITLYAHLGEIWIDDGQPIRAGEKIGREGISGRAGYRHLHFSVHYDPRPWLEALSYYRANPLELPQSIPFETVYCDPRVLSECRRIRARVENIPCATRTPVWLRADWRD